MKRLIASVLVAGTLTGCASRVEWASISEMAPEDRKTALTCADQSATEDMYSTCMMGQGLNPYEVE